MNTLNCDALHHPARKPEPVCFCKMCAYFHKAPVSTCDPFSLTYKKKHNKPFHMIIMMSSLLIWQIMKINWQMRSGAAWGKEVMVEIFWLSCEPPVASARWSSWKRLCVGWDISLIMSLLTWGCIWCIKSLFMLPLCVRQPLHLFFFFPFWKV